jgi:membrane associated rhomboid family serine protease
VLKSFPVLPKSNATEDREPVPVITWTLMCLIVLIYLVDRNFGLFGPSIVFSDLAMRPPEVISALQGGPNRFPIVTIFTSMFLHGGFLHIFANLMFLAVFGPPVEQAVGPWRFVLYYLAWGIAATACQIYASPYRNIPTLGASGAIGGALGAYFLLFPANRLIVSVLSLIDFEVRAWILLGLWFLAQILIPQDGVANWAHAGGFLAGMVTVLVIGGRSAILRQHPELIDADD